MSEASQTNYQSKARTGSVYGVQEEKKVGQQSEPEAQTGLTIRQYPNFLMGSWHLLSTEQHAFSKPITG